MSWACDTGNLNPHPNGTETSGSLRHATTDMQSADIVITPLTHLLPGTDFGAIAAMVAAGKAEAERALPNVLTAVGEVLRPRRS